jgi:hypothetical protein
MIFFIGKEDAIPDEFINVQQMGRCVPLMDYKRNFVHQTRNRFFRSILWMEGIAFVFEIFVS